MHQSARGFAPLLFLLTCALVSSSAGFAQPPARGGEFRIGTSYEQALPRVAASADGSYVVTWIELGSEDRLFGQRYDRAGEEIGAVFQVGEAALLRGSRHAVAADADGDMAVVWTTPNYTVRAQRYDRAGSPRGASFEVSRFGYFYADVAMRPSGSFVVVWANSPYDGNFLQRYDEAGHPLGSREPVSTGLNHRSTVIAMRDDGGFVVSWTASFSLDAQRFDSTGTSVGDAIRVEDWPGGASPSIDVAADGSFVIAWQMHTFGDILAQRYDSTGRPIGGELQVNRDGAPLEGISVAMTDGGDFFVVWSCCRSSESSDVLARQFDRHGNRVGPEFVVNTHRPGSQSAASAAIGADGSLVVAWTSDSPNDDFDGLFGRRYEVAAPSDAAAPIDADADGIPDGSDNCPTVANPEQTDVAGDGFGDDCVSPDVILPPSSSFGRNPVIGAGTTVLAGVRVGDDAILGEHVHLDRQVAIGHRFTAADFVAVGRSTTVGDDVAIGFATRIEGPVRIGNGVTIGDAVVIRRNAVVDDSATIDSNAVVFAGARIGAGATIEMGARVGRGATVRPGAIVPAGTTVGPGATFP